MNYVFNVLWFEDNLGWYRLGKSKLESITEEHCLKCNVVSNRTSDLDTEKLKSTKYDLILMDYDLASKRTGELIIADIRDHNIFTDILFYSSQYDLMISAVASISPPLDGVYYSDRKMELFEAKLSQVVSKIVQRSEDLINLRGFVLDNTCDFELRLREILTICWNKFSDGQKEILHNKMIAQLDGKCGRIRSNIEEAKRQSCVFTYANNNEYLLSVADRLDLLETILPILISEYNLPVSQEFIAFKDYYLKKVNMYRNRLGHVKMGEQVLNVGGQNIPIDQSLHRLLRQNICDVERSIYSIEEHITTKM